MKYLVTSYKNNAEKQEIENKGLYCYDLRHSDEGGEIAGIEKSVLVNRIGSIITDEKLKFGNKRYYNDFIDFKEFSANNTEVYTIEELQDETKENSHKVINGYVIHKEGTWCEITKNGHHIFEGNVDEKMTPEQIYQEVMKEVVFSINGKEVLSYDFLNEFAGERESTIKLLAEKNKFSEKDIEVTIKKPKLDENILKVKYIGIDNWDRPVYKDENGKIYKDTNLGMGELALCTSSNNNFYGEPDTPINEDIEIKIVENFNKDKKQQFIQKSRLLKTDDKEYPYNVQILNSVDGGKNFYYTGNGRLCKTKLEAEDYRKQLEEKGIKKEKIRGREAR